MSHTHSGVCVRRLEREDLPAAIAIQSETYPEFLRENERAFVSRLKVKASYCLAAMQDGALVAYLLAHGWPRQAPPAIGTVLPADAPSEVLFIHDLAVSSAGRGLGLGRMLVSCAFKLASRDGLEAAELIAVAGAASYWRKFGFLEAAASAGLAGKVAAYGPEARWMRHEIVLGPSKPLSAAPAQER